MVNKIVTWIVGLALAAGAVVVTVFIPTDGEGSEQFVVKGEIGTRAEGRNLAATVLDIRLAEAIAAEDWRDESNWLVVDLSAEAVVSQSSGLLDVATLRIGDRTFTAVERGPLNVNLLNTQLIPGVARTGSLFFELPDDALDGMAEMRLATGGTWGDSVLQLNFDLAEVERTETITLAEVDWSAP